MNALEYAIARKAHQLKISPPPLTEEDLRLLSACEKAVKGFQTCRALHAADQARVAARAILRKANGVRQGRYRVNGAAS